MEIPFVKLEGNGNDFVLIDEVDGILIPDEMKGEFARLYCDRRFGIGADGVLFISPSETCNIRMRLFQPDQSEAEMCGNGIRCLVKYAYDSGYVHDTCRVETMAGELDVVLGYKEDEFFAIIDMGTPAMVRADIPATGDGEYKEEIAGYTVYAVNTGVPHAVVFVDEIGGIDIESVAPMIRNHASFPEGANVNFVENTGKDELHIRTFERGVEAETFSCGTGSTASAVIAHHLGMVGEKVLVMTKGGPLTIYVGKEVKMEGPAETIFSGVITF